MSLKANIIGLEDLNRTLKDIIYDVADAMESASEDVAQNSHSVALANMKSSKPLHWWTIAIKGHDKKFEDSGMYLHIFRVYRNFSDKKNKLWFVGVPTGVTNKKGLLYTNVAKILEFGTFINVTQKMRAYFYHNFGIVISPKKEVIFIPPRPHIRPMNTFALNYAPKQLRKNVLESFRFAKRKAKILHKK